MSNQTPDPIDSRWREALAELRGQEDLRTGLETRVAASLAAQRGRVGMRRTPLALLAMAAVLLAAVAVLLFRPGAAGPATNEGTRYLLLLYEGGRFNPGGATNEQLVREYGAWAGGLAERGTLVDASELGNEERLLSGAGESTRGAAGVISGFFIVRAADLTEAAAIAATCPHLKHGGEVAVRPLRG